MIFRCELDVNSHACDCHSLVRPGATMTYLQEAANLQLRTYGPTDPELRALGRAFVLSRIDVHLHEPIHGYERLTAETWAAPSHGFSFLRHHRLLRDGRIITEATTVWALIDVATKHPLRVEEYHPNFAEEPLPEGAEPKRLRLPRCEMEYGGKYTVRYADTDLNRHMNNTVYADMLCGFLDLGDRRVTRFSINYFNEAPLGEELSVYRLAGEAEGETFFRSLRSDGKTNVEAVFYTELL